MKRLIFVLFLFISNCFSDTITGIVLTGERKPVGNAEVSISKSSEPQTVIRKLISDRKGRFRFDDLESGYYKIVAKKKPFC
ncbi:MAG: carboxypeptidase-like regulatory domain-containing protein, partial [Candidatus Omnitrophica bacterium]|nr:carboxypeptidase-like regulatory domain-containing protein [Candidatus Omnitrophota bacterium]